MKILEDVLVIFVLQGKVKISKLKQKIRDKLVVLGFININNIINFSRFLY